MDEHKAKATVLNLFRDWSIKRDALGINPNGNDAFQYYLKLESERPDVFSFQNDGDAWQTVHSWLIDVNIVSDRG